LIAVFLVRGLISSQHTHEKSAATQTVAVAVAPVEAGMALKPEMVKLVRYPADAVPTGSFQTLDQLFDKSAPPRVTARAIGQNGPVLISDLSGPGSKATLASVIPAGMRAVSLRSSDVAGVAGFVLPGDRVDILLTRQIGTGENAKKLTQLVAENALVLGVDQVSDQSADKPIVAKAITVQVTPDQAQTISLGQSVGDLSLALRQGNDSTPLTRRLTTVADLGGFQQAKAPVRHVAARPSGLIAVRVVRGVEPTPYSVGAN
jgi:pilus assembly protein CpaB